MTRKYIISLFVIIFLTLTCYSQQAKPSMNAVDSLGRKIGYWEWVPDSINKFWYPNHFVRNRGKELHLFALSDSIGKKLQDTVITIRANFKDGKMHGRFEYFINNKYPLAIGEYDRGLLDGIQIVYGGDYAKLLMVQTYCDGVQEGYDMFFNILSITCDFYVEGERIFESSYRFRKAFLLPYKNGKVKNGTYFTPHNDGAYWKVTYRGGELTKREYLKPYVSNIIYDGTKKSGERVYCWGKISDFFGGKDKSKFHRWIRRQF